jgi:hypothetical protein
MTEADFIQRIDKFHRFGRIFNRLMGIILWVSATPALTLAWRDSAFVRGYALCWLPGAIVFCIIWYQLLPVIQRMWRDKYGLRCPKCRNNLVPIGGETSPIENGLVRNDTERMKERGKCWYCGCELFYTGYDDRQRMDRQHDQKRLERQRFSESQNELQRLQDEFRRLTRGK